jgi:hypothetical protein
VAGLASFGRRARRRGSAHRCGVRWLATPARRGWIGANLREGGASCWGGMRKEEQMKGSLDCRSGLLESVRDPESMGPGRKNGCSGIRERHLGPFRCYSHHLYFEFLDRLNSRAKEMSDARLCYCTPSHCRMPLHPAPLRPLPPRAESRAAATS